MNAWKALVWCAPVLLAGCAHGFNRDLLQERLNDGSLQVTDTAIAEARSLKPQLKLPCRVAFYLKPSNQGDWRWTTEDRAALEPLTAALKRDGFATEVFALPEMLGGKGELKDLRLAAAKCGADVLLVVNGASQSDKYKNPAALLYLTIVGGYVVPGDHVDSLFVIEGCLFDVDNGFLYTSAQAEGVGKIVRPSFLIEEKDAVAKAKKKALGQFADELLGQMKGLAGFAASLPPQSPPGTHLLPGTASHLTLPKQEPTPLPAILPVNR